MWGLAISATQCYANCRIVFRSVCCGCSEEQHREHFNPSRAGCVFSITPQDHHQRNHKDTKKMRDNRTENPHIHKHMAPMVYCKCHKSICDDQMSFPAHLLLPCVCPCVWQQRQQSGTPVVDQLITLQLYNPHLSTTSAPD